MKITNKNGYPKTLVAAVTNDPYSKGDSEFSATGLIQPPRVRVLTNRHWDEIEVDVDSRLFALYGQIGHGLVERAGNPLTNVIERRFFGEVLGTKISAQIDSLSLEADGTLIDWKFTAVYGFKVGRKPKDEWTYQMNVQLELMRRNGLDAKRLQIWGILRDWRPGESKKERGYPKKLGFHEIKMWPREKTVKWIEDRITAHRAADKELPECSTTDNWNWVRCHDYCDVANFCTQFKKYKEATDAF